MVRTNAVIYLWDWILSRRFEFGWEFVVYGLKYWKGRVLILGWGIAIYSKEYSTLCLSENKKE